jgi:hypothetical protein
MALVGEEVYVAFIKREQLFGKLVDANPLFWLEEDSPVATLFRAGYKKVSYEDAVHQYEFIVTEASIG